MENKEKLIKVRQREKDDKNIICCCKGCEAKATMVSRMGLPMCTKHFKLSKKKMDEVADQLNKQGYDF